MARFSILVDVAKCNGCYNCFLSCRDEYYGNDYPSYSAAQPLNGQFWMQLVEIERGVYPKPKLSYIPKPCMHCENAPCIDAAKDGAVYRRDDGIVMIDPEKSKGQKEIVNACPYRVIYWNEEQEIAQKCTMCAHRLDEGEKMPRCVESCPTGALLFGDLDDPESEVAKLAARLNFEDLKPEFNTGSLVKYAGVPKRFVAGEVVYRDNQGECAAGVRVSLSGGGLNLETKTDVFGDFEFEGLDRNRTYKVLVRADRYQQCEIEFNTPKDVNLGEILLDPQK
ncbi:4Fe-4S dicluster domain-containing protein [Desulforhopalus singaporensis]|uniref:Fe-S-cluster-containing dehydrogenase component n=1 Tax=Desulforhopalus singaporensis TaxID=91360 RepID=A0A1H0ITY6_9BACT|nr:4Fe-4S dicluster domain-containing protein [Desulforhopalus singaporensis]SDO34936.1 Fe-S-cluster-containing dehydrogenase component [Desulforhopalus singaporensis]